jgi:hypothetical protein
MGSYWLTHLKSKAMTPAMEIFSEWLLKEAAEDVPLNPTLSHRERELS